jgi:hypothetical protein
VTSAPASRRGSEALMARSTISPMAAGRASCESPRETLFHSQPEEIYFDARHIHACRALTRFPEAVPASQHHDSPGRRATVDRAPRCTHMSTEQQTLASNRNRLGTPVWRKVGPRTVKRPGLIPTTPNKRVAGSLANRPGRKVRCTFDFPKTHNPRGPLSISN